MNVKSSRQKLQPPDYNTPIILVVEDEENNLLLISQILILLKYNFITAKTGQEALSLARKYEIDLVLLDLVLPDINGFEIISLLKENNLTRKMPILVVSALVRKQERDRAFSLGCDDYLSKPYLIEDLEAKIQKLLPKNFFRGIFSQIAPFYNLFPA